MPKGKGKKKGKKKNKAIDPNKLAPIDRQFYELIIADLNQKLAHLRTQLTSLEDKNVTLTDQLHELKEDRVDISAHLERALAERADTIVELEERFSELVKVRNKEKAKSAKRIKDLEAKYKSVHEQLTSEIKLLTGKLNSLDEFRVQRDALLAKFDDQDAEVKEKERLHKEQIFNLEQQAVVEKDKLKKEVEAKLLQVSEDFTRSNEIRNASYTRRLIRENIALQKEMHKVILEQIRLQELYSEQVAKNNELDEQFGALAQIKEHLVATNENQVKILHKMTNAYEQLQSRFMEATKYRKMYEVNVQKTICGHFLQMSSEQKISQLNERTKLLKKQRRELMDRHKIKDSELQRLTSTMSDLKNAIYGILENWENQGLPENDVIAITELKRELLLKRLKEIISGQALSAPTPPVSRPMSPVYYRGDAGFLPQSTVSLIELFRRDVHHTMSTDLTTLACQLRKYADDDDDDETKIKILPEFGATDAETIVDIRMYSSLSTDDEDNEPDKFQQKASKQHMEMGATTNSPRSGQTILSTATTPTETHGGGDTARLNDDDKQDSFEIDFFY